MNSGRRIDRPAAAGPMGVCLTAVKNAALAAARFFEARTPSNAGTGLPSAAASIASPETPQKSGDSR